MQRRIAVLIVALAATANADDEPPPRPTSAEDVANAPQPGAESGRVEDEDDGDGVGRVVVRGTLFIPKAAFYIVDAPIRGALWLNQRYALGDLYYRVFFNDNRTFGIVPTGSFDTHFGWTAGARMTATNLFDAGESFGAYGTVGEVFRANAGASLRSGKRLGEHIELGLEGSFERHPNDIFWGIGNGDLQKTPPAMPVDPRRDDTALEARYRYEMERVALVADIKPVKQLHIKATGALTDLDLGTSPDDGDNMPIDALYDPNGLVGFSDVKHAYGELEVRWDGRRAASRWDSSVVYSGGGLAAAFAGRVHRLDPGTDFTRYGGELQYFIRLADGPRVLATRFHFEGVTGSLDDVPLTELPRLGGAAILRGYDTDRFRDRVAAVASAEYSWDLSQMLDASLFVDVGRVYPGLEAITLDALRCGYGAAISLHGESSFVLQASLASSIDGGLFFNLAFNRAFDATTRWR